MTEANIARNVVDDQPDDVATTTKPDVDQRIKNWVPFTRNMQHFALARHPRTKLPPWRKSEKTGRSLCDLTDEIQIQLSAAATRKVAPNGLDIALTLALAREQRFKVNSELRLSGQYLLKAVGLPATSYNYKRLEASLLYLSQVRILMRNFYADGTHEPRLFLPPIQHYKEDGRTHWRITFNPQWVFKIEDGYFTRIPIDLPLDAVAQCLVLWLWTQVPADTPKSRKRQGTIFLTTLYRKLGLNSDDNGRRALQTGINIATQWLRDRGADLDLTVGKICTYRAIVPKVGQNRATRERQRERIARAVDKKARISEQFETAKRVRAADKENAPWVRSQDEFGIEPPDYDEGAFN